MGVLIQHCASKALSLLLPILRSMRRIWCPETGVDFYGHDDAIHGCDHGWLYASDWNACGEICELVTDCLYWTFIEDINSCNLKYSDEGVTKKAGVISGARGCM